MTGRSPGERRRQVLPGYALQNLTPRTQVGLFSLKSQEFGLDKGRTSEFKTSAAKSSLLFLSQKHHNNWQARVFKNDAWQNAQTIAVNEIFQGVILPETTEKVRLEFKPYIRFIWLTQMFWLIMTLYLVFPLLKLLSRRVFLNIEKFFMTGVRDLHKRHDNNLNQ